MLSLIALLYGGLGGLVRNLVGFIYQNRTEGEVYDFGKAGITLAVGAGFTFIFVTGLQYIAPGTDTTAAFTNPIVQIVTGAGASSLCHEFLGSLSKGSKKAK